MNPFVFLILLVCFFGFRPTAYANELSVSVQNQLQELKERVSSLHSTVQDLKSTVKSQNEIIEKQSLRLNALEGQRGQTLPQSQPVGIGPKLAGLSQGINPEIGVTGTVQAKLTELHEDAEGNDTIALKELELGVAQYVDPYSRLDAILTFNDNLESQNVDIEEAYYSHWGLPLGFKGQIGKFRSKIGKQNLQHLHALDNADYAEVIKDFLGEEGLASSGARLVHDIPNPWDIPIEITGEVLRGNNGRSFSGISRRPIFNTHAKTFFELTEDSNLELGWTTLFGDENPPQFAEVNGVTGEVVNATAADGRDKYGVKVYGADATFNFLLPEGKNLKFQNEVYIQRRGNLVHINDDPWGFYSLLDYRFSPKFSAGIRFDYVEPLDVVGSGSHLRTTGVSPYLTFWQSEFASFKVQYSHTDPADPNGISDDAVYLQANVLIGAHKHPVQ